ncbi:MAG: hypothetical protein ACI8Y4_003592, partial [Candidatus Poriferisodalaceae bacterium]
MVEDSPDSAGGVALELADGFGFGFAVSELPV